MDDFTYFNFILVRGWHRNLQYILLGSYSQAPLSTKVLLELEFSGVENINKSTIGKWHSGKSIPRPKNVEEIYAALSRRAIKRKDNLAIIRINKSKDWLSSNGNLSMNPQIRLIQYASIWANPSTSQLQAHNIIHMIKNKWIPTSITTTMQSIDKNIECEFEFPSVSADIKHEIPLNGTKINHRLLVPTDPTSIANFLFSLCESPWPLQQPNKTQPFEHDNSFTDWCIDLVGACLLVDRLHLSLGAGSYKNGSRGIGLSKRVILFITGSSYFGKTPTANELKCDLKSVGYYPENIDNILDSLVCMKLRVGDILAECGTNWDEIANCQRDTFNASFSLHQVF